MLSHKKNKEIRQFTNNNNKIHTCAEVHDLSLLLNTVAIALSTIAITHLYIISIQIAIMSIVKPCLHITMK